MLSSSVTAPTTRPLSVLAEVNYREVDKSVVDAKGRPVDAVLRGPVRLDRSVYEFPGDRTYENYLAKRGNG